MTAQGVNFTLTSFMDFPVQLHYFCMNVESEMVLTPSEALFLEVLRRQHHHSVLPVGQLDLLSTAPGLFQGLHPARAVR